MRIAWIVPAPLTAISGGYGYDRAIIAGLRAAGHAVEVIELDGRHPLADAPAEASAIAAWRGLADDAVVVIDGLALPAFAPRAALLAERRTIGLIHHPTALEAGLAESARAMLLAAERLLFSHLARAIVTSPATARLLQADFAVAPARIAVVVPGTDAAPRSAGSGGPGCHILTVGSLIPRKGHDVLLRALAMLGDLDWHLTIAGGPLDGAHGRQLAALAATLGIAARVRFAGTVVDGALAELWQRADIFALATHFEGYGM